MRAFAFGVEHKVVLNFNGSAVGDIDPLVIAKKSYVVKSTFKVFKLYFLSAF